MSIASVSLLQLFQVENEWRSSSMYVSMSDQKRIILTSSAHCDWIPKFWIAWVFEVFSM